MGILSKLVSNDDMSGYKKFDNKQGWNNAVLLEKLSGITTSLGKPEMGSIKIFGKEVEAIVYNETGEDSCVYIKADAKKIEIGSSPKPGTGVGSVMLDSAAILVGGGTNEEGSKLNRCIDEMQGVMERLLAGESVTESVPLASAPADAVKLYMAEKLTLSLKDKYSICNKEQEPMFYVQGNILETAYTIWDAQDNEVMVIKKKLVAVMPEYTVFEGKKEIARFKKKLTLSRPEINGTVGNRQISIKGDLFGHSFNVMSGDTMIGGIDKEQLT